MLVLPGSRPLHLQVQAFDPVSTIGCCWVVGSMIEGIWWEDPGTLESCFNQLSRSLMWLLSTWSEAGVTEELYFEFYLTLINLKLKSNSHLWLASAVSDRSSPGSPRRPYYTGQREEPRTKGYFVSNEAGHKLFQRLIKFQLESGIYS